VSNFQTDNSEPLSSGWNVKAEKNSGRFPRVINEKTEVSDESPEIE